MPSGSYLTVYLHQWGIHLYAFNLQLDKEEIGGLCMSVPNEGFLDEESDVHLSKRAIDEGTEMYKQWR